MKKIIQNAALVLLFVSLGNTIVAQGKISVDELAGIIDSKDIIVVDCRKAEDFTKMQIKNAINVYHGDLYKEGPVPSILKSSDEVAKILGSKGIDSNKKIVLYDEGSGKYAGRMYWILDYLGAKQVAVLDGEMRAWRAARKPLTSSPAPVKPALFVAAPDKSKLATIDEVKKAQGDGSSVLVDVRTADEYNGVAESKIRKGHIPGSVNIDFESVMDAKGLIKPAAEIKAIFAASGITPDKTVILFCETSVRAGIVYNALKNTAGFSKVKVYDGANVEWQSSPSNKVE